MATLALELQMEALRRDRKAAIRTEVEARERKLVHDVVQRELTTEEDAIVIAEVNKILFGREQWLRQMREAEMRSLRGHTPPGNYTLVEETAILDEADDLLRRKNPQFIKNYKYDGSDASPEAVGASNNFGTELKGMFSKITDFLGDGSLGFIGKLFNQILGFISPLLSAFQEMGEKLNPKKVPGKSAKALVKKGALDQADADLELQEQQLIDKLQSIEKKEGGEVKEIKELVDEYQKQLSKLQRVKLNDGTKIPFAQLTEEYKKQTLKLRIEMFDELSSKAAPILKAHAEVVNAEQAYKFQEEKRKKLDSEIYSLPSPEVLAVLTARMNAIKADIKTLTEKRDRADVLEKSHIAHAAEGDVSIVAPEFKARIVNMFDQHKQQDRAQEKIKQEGLANYVPRGPVPEVD